MGTMTGTTFASVMAEMNKTALFSLQSVYLEVH